MKRFSSRIVGKLRSEREREQSGNSEMPNTGKLMKHYRLEADAIEAITAQAKATGKTMTKVIEDAVLRRDRFSQHARELIERKMRETGWTFDDVVEYCVVTCNGDPIKGLGKKKRSAAKK